MNCPECGRKRETTSQDAATGGTVFACAAGHTWPADDDDGTAGK